MEENGLFIKSHASGAGTVLRTFNRLKGFIFPVEYSAKGLIMVLVSYSSNVRHF
jgi:hypothetical protein